MSGWPSNRPRFADILQKAMQLAEDLVKEGYDDSIVVDALDSETEVLAIVDRVAERVIADQRLAASAKARAKRLEERAETSKKFLAYVLSSLNRKSLERPLGTVHFQDNPQGVEILGEVPAEYRTEVPDKAAIKRALVAGKEVENARLSPPSRHLRILTT